MKKDGKKDDEGFSNPFRNLEKASVLQETRTFNETPISAKKCGLILTKILYMINQVCFRLTCFKACLSFLFHPLSRPCNYFYLYSCVKAITCK